jgi:phosphoribosylanthranilate isomerase
MYLQALSFIKTVLLSGGIGLEEIAAVNEITKTNLPVYAIDVNSKFEIEPGLKIQSY